MKKLLPVLMGGLLALAGCLQEDSSAAQEAEQNRAQRKKVSPQVLEALKQRAEVQVVIALKAPSSAQPAEIAKLQDQVLSKLDSEDFELTSRFRSIPALAGKIKRSGIEKISTDPNVLRIDLDMGGSGN